MWRLATFALLVLCPSVSQALTMDMVRVSNPGNTPDTRYATPGYGNVNYAYLIGKYEVTTGQYTEFLNAVAADDAYGLYNTRMWSADHGCKIQRSGLPGDYTYSVADNRTNRPVNYVSWCAAARFANWLHNGQPTGAQDLTTTEDGVYYLNGATSRSELQSITRESDATWFIPTEDEWYKAAYHKNNGVTGDYLDYPTGSDDQPSNELVDPDPGNNANFYQEDYTIGGPYWTTEVGEFENSASPYGTFDQGGNLKEWNETQIHFGLSRGVRGGFWFDESIKLHASYRGSGIGASGYSPVVGFRLASIPEPLFHGDMNDDGYINGLDVTGFVNAILRGTFNPYADMTGNDGPNGLDVAPFVEAVLSGGGPQAVPEPCTLGLTVGALLGLLCWRRTGW